MNATEIIGNPFIIKNLEIAQFDFPSQMLWVDELHHANPLENYGVYLQLKNGQQYCSQIDI